MAEQIRNLKCFLSYRRKDLIVVGSIHRIYQALEREFGEGHVFMDIDNLPPGANFREVLAQKVNRVCAGGGLGYFNAGGAYPSFFPGRILRQGYGFHD